MSLLRSFQEMSRLAHTIGAMSGYCMIVPLYFTASERHESLLAATFVRAVAVSFEPTESERLA